MRLWRLVALPVFLGFFILGAYLYYYLGGYKPVLVELVERPEVQVISRSHRGAYHQINNVIVQVEEWAKSKQVPCSRTFGEYLDDPRQVDEGRLRSKAGCVLEQPLDPATLPPEISASTLSAGRYVRAEFTGSPAIGPWKVYPKLTEFAEQHKLKPSTSSIEIYTLTADGKMLTEYLLPVQK
ncbi:MAG: GyrI-like domain-containing protein [Bdellovibrionales bacterium]